MGWVNTKEWEGGSLTNDQGVESPSLQSLSYLNYSWNFGSLASLLLGSQMITGILLAMHYVRHVNYAFASVQHT